MEYKIHLVPDRGKRHETELAEWRKLGKQSQRPVVNQDKFQIQYKEKQIETLSVERCILSIVVNVPCDQRCQCYSIRVSRPCHFKIARCKKQLIMTTLEYLVVTLTKNQMHTTTALVIKPTHHHRLMVIIRTQHAQFRHPVPEPQPISPLISTAVV